MNRREFITLLGGAAAACPLAARAQQTGKLLTIGFLGGGTPASQRNMGRRVRATAARARLERGPHSRRRVSLGGGTHRELCRDCGRVCPTQGRCHCHRGWRGPGREDVRPIIPIVLAAATDPLGGGLVAGRARPGGHTTGLSMQSSDAAGKRLDLLRELLPGLRRLAVIGNVEYPATVQEIAEVRAAAGTLGLDLDVLEIRRADDIVGTFPVLKAGSQALYVCASPLVNANHARINTLALGARVPTMHAVRDFLGAGGFMSYGPSLPHSFRRAADYVDKILRGAKPGDLPVEQPTNFDL